MTDAEKTDRLKLLLELARASAQGILTKEEYEELAALAKSDVV